MKAFIQLTFVRLSDGFLAPFHPRWNHWNYLEAEPCSDSEGSLSGRVPGEGQPCSKSYCHRVCAPDFCPGRCLSFYFAF